MDSYRSPRLQLERGKGVTWILSLLDDWGTDVAPRRCRRAGYILQFLDLGPLAGKGGPFRAPR